MKETKVYVDELPKSCWECPCFKNDLEFPCGLSDGTQDYFKDEIDGENCPLKSIKTHDRELVKEVCEKIKLKFSDTRSHNWGVERIELYEFLDQIQKEAENE